MADCAGEEIRREGRGDAVAVRFGDRSWTYADVADRSRQVAAALQREPAATIAAAELSAELTAALAAGAVLRSHRFDRYRTTEKPEERPRLAGLTLLAVRPSRSKEEG